MYYFTSFHYSSIHQSIDLSINPFIHSPSIPWKRGLCLLPRWDSGFKILEETRHVFRNNCNLRFKVISHIMKVHIKALLVKTLLVQSDRKVCFNWLKQKREVTGSSGLLAWLDPDVQIMSSGIPPSFPSGFLWVDFIPCWQMAANNFRPISYQLSNSSIKREPLFQ